MIKNIATENTGYTEIFEWFPSVGSVVKSFAGSELFSHLTQNKYFPCRVLRLRSSTYTRNSAQDEVRAERRAGVSPARSRSVGA